MDITVALLFCYIVFAHTVADFMFQTDDMAVNKSSSNSWLLKHTGTYTLVMFAFMCLLGLSGATMGVLGFGGLAMLTNPHLVIGFLFVNFVAHTITDYITSRITSYYWKQEKRHEFFVTIGFDQFAHIAVLVLTWALIFGV